jgi:Ca2+-binding EF-hand superfamily protein
LVPDFSLPMFELGIGNPSRAKETNMDRQFKAFLTMLAFLLGAAPAGAQDTASSFAALDKDKDGMISVTEAKADKQIAAKFAVADKDQDGFLSRAEYDAIVKR